MTSADSSADLQAKMLPQSASRWCVPSRPARSLNTSRPLRLLSLGMVALLQGCGSGTEDPGPTRTVYFDLATKRVLVADGTSEYPAVHPQTGQATLMPAMYCEVCQAWRQVPPPDQWNRLAGPIRCVKDQQPLVPTGPLPEEMDPDGD